MSSRHTAARRPIPQPADEPPTQSPAVKEHNAVSLGPRDRMIGVLYVDGDLRVGGIVEGEVEVTGDFEVDDAATVKASVAARQVSIRGQVNGPVVARNRLVVARSGSLIGDVRVPRLVVQDGATFSGNVSMTASPENATRTPMIETKPVEVPEAEATAVVPEIRTETKIEAKPVPQRDGAAPKVVRAAAAAPAPVKGGKGKPQPPAKVKPKRR